MSRSVAHLPRAEAHVVGDFDTNEDTMGDAPTPGNHLARRGRRSSHEVVESSLRQVVRLPWMDTLLGEM